MLQADSAQWKHWVSVYFSENEGCKYILFFKVFININQDKVYYRGTLHMLGVKMTTHYPNNVVCTETPVHRCLWTQVHWHRLFKIKTILTLKIEPG